MAAFCPKGGGRKRAGNAARKLEKKEPPAVPMIGFLNPASLEEGSLRPARLPPASPRTASRGA